VIYIRPLFLALVLLVATGCSEKKEEKTVVAPQKSARSTTIEENTTRQSSENLSKISTMLENTASLESLEGETHTVILDEGRFILEDIKKPLLLVTFFSTWCPPCRGEIPYFEDMEKKYKKMLFITAILVNDESNRTTLKYFCQTHQMHYFVSNGKKNGEIATKVAEALKLDANFTLPLTILYKDGDYYTHYEGMVPIEMIDHDIQTALKSD